MKIMEHNNNIKEKLCQKKKKKSYTQIIHTQRKHKKRETDRKGWQPKGTILNKNQESMACIRS
jgi:hypothetical protein